MSIKIRLSKGRVVMDFKVFLQEGEHVEAPTLDQVPLVLEWYSNQATLLRSEEFEITYNPRHKRFRATFKNTCMGMGNITEEAYELASPPDKEEFPLKIGEKEYIVTGYVD
jgi:hypothetical protein